MTTLTTASRSPLGQGSPAMSETIEATPPLPVPPAPPPPSSDRRPKHPSPRPFKPVPAPAPATIVIDRISARLSRDPPIHLNISTPIAVAIGPYHHGSPRLQAMEVRKRAAMVEFCQVAGKPPNEVLSQILPLARTTARSCYAYDENTAVMDDDKLAEMLLRDGCFLVEFMIFMCQEKHEPVEEDPLMTTSKALVVTQVDTIARDVLLLENQIPWAVLKVLTDLRPGVSVAKFLDRMAHAFDMSSSSTASKPSSASLQLESPDHLLGLFHRRLVGSACTQSLRNGILPSPCSSLELAEMGVKLTASKTKVFGHMKMKKHRWPMGLFGELSLAPLVLTNQAACWLLNMAAYEACLGTTRDNDFAVSSYVSVLAVLMSRGEDVRALRARGIIFSTMTDEATLCFFEWAAQCLRVGEPYFHISQKLQEYKKKRWIWIAVHRFFYRYMKTIVAVVSVVGALAGLLKLIPSLEHTRL